MSVRLIVKKTRIILITILCVFFVAACNFKKEHLFQGRTMGTSYRIKVVSHILDSPSHLKKKIDHRLNEINQSMSTFIKTSEISKFNQSTDINQEHYVSDDLLYVMTIAKDIHQLTGGAWDGTLKPLVDEWGFGSKDQNNGIPDGDTIQKILASMGFDFIEITSEGYLRKKKSSITVDLASIAKGYAVDEVSEIIRRNGFSDYIVEIGGEIFASGVRLDGNPWRVGINTPAENAPFDLVYKTVELRNMAMATSGDYRNFFEKNGIRYSHILDPRTGYPVRNGVVSVSILSESCVFADGLATAIVVLGPKAGIELVDQLNNTECFIITENEMGNFTDYISKGFGRN